MTRHAPDRVVLVHPRLPGRVINVHRRAVPAYREVGWTRPKSPATPAVEPTKTADAVRIPQGDDPK